jgi:hypothetical protein
MNFYAEHNHGQFESDVMARVQLPAPVNELAVFCDMLLAKARESGHEAFLRQEGCWLLIRKADARKMRTSCGHKKGPQP